VSRIFILYLVSLTVRSLVLAALTGLFLLWSRKVPVRHAAWTVVLCSVLLMPIADAVLPAAMVPAFVPRSVLPIQLPMRVFIGVVPQSAVSGAPDANLAPSRPSMDGWPLAVSCTLLVALVLLIRLTLGFREVARIRNGSRLISTPIWEDLRASKTQTSGTISLRESAAVTVPITLGFWRPVLILPLDWHDWDDWTLRAVLTHERTHVQRFDWAISVVAALAKCLFWFNPLVWWIERTLSSLAEQASDEACVRSSGDPRRYAETLLYFAAIAKRGHRWNGGVAMAQHKIRLRIERVLALRQPGSGVFPRAGWAALFLLAIPALYGSAAVRSGQAPVIPRIEAKQFLQQRVPVSDQTAMAISPQTPPAAPSQEGQGIRQPQTNTSPQGAILEVVPTPSLPVNALQQITPAAPLTPDLVGEIHLILAPVDTQGPGQGTIEYRTRSGTNRYTGTAVWSFRNGAINSWGTNNNAFAFALTGIQDRKALFEGSSGSTFSYGCSDCSFLVWDSGVGLPSANGGPGIVFRLSPDGKSLLVTCRATECRLGTATGGYISTTNGVSTVGETLAAGSFMILPQSESRTLGVSHGSPLVGASNVNGTCFNLSVSANAEGALFSDGNCLASGAATVLFSVTR